MVEYLTNYAVSLEVSTEALDENVIVVDEVAHLSNCGRLIFAIDPITRRVRSVNGKETDTNTPTSY